MSRLDEIIEEIREYQRGITTDRLIGTKPEESKREIKKLFLDLLKEAEYDAWTFVGKVDDL